MALIVHLDTNAPATPKKAQASPQRQAWPGASVVSEGTSFVFVKELKISSETQKYVFSQNTKILKLFFFGKVQIKL